MNLLISRELIVVLCGSFRNLMEEGFGFNPYLSRFDNVYMFGTSSGSAINGSDALKKSEEQKRKARAERFGSLQSAPADEEAKKKARLARFAGVPKTDPLEEDKKKARAIRFSQPPSGAISQVNGKVNDIDMVAIPGKVGGET
ncbi:protein MODIFIER OF SNC1 11-like isoform X2 [Actinidia eriantha]|uniref:protein MODIFIER OF SNC1 11-like isoform X2 n=1 Tax=Actinidia eriantha TaxID=165200 RepID=UPI00258F3653|nr:protein MODIFIER OF SNC1 11-like isoform X2 [Actinidia eriantha]